MIYDNISQTIGRTPVVGMLEVASKAPGERYLSTALFAGVETGADVVRAHFSTLVPTLPPTPVVHPHARR